MSCRPAVNVVAMVGVVCNIYADREVDRARRRPRRPGVDSVPCMLKPGGSSRKLFKIAAGQTGHSPRPQPTEQFVHIAFFSVTLVGEPHKQRRFVSLSELCKRGMLVARSRYEGKMIWIAASPSADGPTKTAARLLIIRWQSKRG